LGFEVLSIIWCCSVCGLGLLKWVGGWVDGCGESELVGVVLRGQDEGLGGCPGGGGISSMVKSLNT